MLPQVNSYLDRKKLQECHVPSNASGKPRIGPLSTGPFTFKKYTKTTQISTCTVSVQLEHVIVYPCVVCDNRNPIERLEKSKPDLKVWLLGCGGVVCAGQ